HFARRTNYCGHHARYFVGARNGERLEPYNRFDDGTTHSGSPSGQCDASASRWHYFTNCEYDIASSKRRADCAEFRGCVPTRRWQKINQYITVAITPPVMESQLPLLPTWAFLLSQQTVFPRYSPLALQP